MMYCLLLLMKYLRSNMNLSNRIFAAGTVEAADWLKRSVTRLLQIRRFINGQRGVKTWKLKEIIRYIQTASKRRL